MINKMIYQHCKIQNIVMGLLFVCVCLCTVYTMHMSLVLSLSILTQ